MISSDSARRITSAYFAPLTGIRAVSAYLIFTLHFNYFADAKYGSVLKNFTEEFHIGVTLFFVLSGFLISLRYSDMINFNFKNYAINRIARIYPIYFILTTLTFLSYAVIKGQNGTTDLFIYLSNISFVRGFSSELLFTGIPQGWSLSVEETFYLLAPLLFILLKRSNIYLLILPVLLISCGLCLVLVCQNHSSHGFFSSYQFMFDYTFFGRCCEFFAGIALAIVFKKKTFSFSIPYLTYIGLVAIVLCTYTISLVKGGFDTGIRHPVGKLINTLILPFGIAVFYLGLLKEKTIISNVLGSRLFVILGKSSYIFYLLHMGVFSIAIHKLIPGYFMFFIILNISSVILFKFIEEPLNAYIKQKITSPKISFPITISSKIPSRAVLEPNPSNEPIPSEVA